MSSFMVYIPLQVGYNLEMEIWSYIKKKIEEAFKVSVSGQYTEVFLLSLTIYSLTLWK